MQEKLLDIGLGSNFLNTSAKAQATKAKISGTTSQREKTNRMEKRNPMKWGRIFANCLYDKGLISNILKTQTTQLSKWAEGMNRQFSSKDIQMAKDTRKGNQHHESSGKLKSKPQ